MPRIKQNRKNLAAITAKVQVYGICHLSNAFYYIFLIINKHLWLQLRQKIHFGCVALQTIRFHDLERGYSIQNVNICHSNSCCVLRNMRNCTVYIILSPSVKQESRLAILDDFKLD